MLKFFFIKQKRRKLLQKNWINTIILLVDDVFIIYVFFSFCMKANDTVTLLIFFHLIGIFNSFYLEKLTHTE